MAKKSFFRTVLDYVSFAIGTTSPSGVVVDNREVCQTKEEQATCDSCICESAPSCEGGANKSKDDDKPVVKKVRVKKTPVEIAVAKAKRAAKKAKTAE